MGAVSRDFTVEHVMRLLASPSAAVGAALVRRSRAIGVRLAGGDADRGESRRLGLWRTPTQSDRVDSLQVLAAPSALGVVPLKKHDTNDTFDLQKCRHARTGAERRIN